MAFVAWVNQGWNACISGHKKLIIVGLALFYGERCIAFLRSWSRLFSCFIFCYLQADQLVDRQLFPSLLRPSLPHGNFSIIVAVKKLEIRTPLNLEFLWQMSITEYKKLLFSIFFFLSFFDIGEFVFVMQISSLRLHSKRLLEQRMLLGSMSHTAASQCRDSTELSVWALHLF